MFECQLITHGSETLGLQGKTVPGAFPREIYQNHDPGISVCLSQTPSRTVPDPFKALTRGF